MKLEDVLELFNEEALNNTTKWKKRSSLDDEKEAKIKVGKGKGDTLSSQRLPITTTEEGRAKSYVRTMKASHVDSEGKKKHYDSGKIRQGLPSTFRHITDEEAGTSVFNILKILRSRGEMDNKSIMRNKTLTKEQKEQLLAITPKK